GSTTFRLRPASVVEDSPPLDLAQRTQQLASMEEIIVSDVLLNTAEGQITITSLPDRPGNCSRIFQAVAGGGIVVDMIVQNLGNDGRAELSFSVPRNELEHALKLAREAAETVDPRVRVSADPEIARLFVFGVGMRTHTGVARRMFGA